MIGPVHYGTGNYAHGTGATGGLTHKGREVMKAMEEVGMILDITHLAEESCWQGVGIYKGAVLSSHNNCRAPFPGDRHFADHQPHQLTLRAAR